MVFEKFREMLNSRRDNFSLKGLEQFTPEQQERILNRIATKEAEISDIKANRVLRKRMLEMERRSGILPKGSKKEGKGGLQKFKEFRQANLKRRESNLDPLDKKIKPTSKPRPEPEKLKIKPIKLKAPGGF